MITTPPPAGREALARAVRDTIRDVPDFPKPGIVFKDITPLLSDAALFARVTNSMAEVAGPMGITHVVAIESRGFLFGAPVAQRLGVALVPVRKPGKLPHRSVREDYALEYGSDALEMHEDALRAGARVLVVDDVLATGGTAVATRRLVEKVGGIVVAYAFLIDLTFLHGPQVLMGSSVDAIVEY